MKIALKRVRNKSTFYFYLSCLIVTLYTAFFLFFSVVSIILLL